MITTIGFIIVCLITLTYFIGHYNRERKERNKPKEQIKSQITKERNANQVTQEELTHVLNWLQMMDIIEFDEYNRIRNDALPYVKITKR
jgi:uncharacterized membrane protein